MTVGHENRILVTRQFDQRDVIGYLQLRPDIELLPDDYFALAYTVLEERDGKATKIRVHEVSLVATPPYIPHEVAHCAHCGKMRASIAFQNGIVQTNSTAPLSVQFPDLCFGGCQ